MAIVQPTKWKKKQKANTYRNKNKKTRPHRYVMKTPLLGFLCCGTESWLIHSHVENITKKGKGKNCNSQKMGGLGGSRTTSICCLMRISSTFFRADCCSFVCILLVFVLLLLFTVLRPLQLISTFDPAGRAKDHDRRRFNSVGSAWKLLPKRACVHVYCREIKRKRRRRRRRSESWWKEVKGRREA